PLRRAALRGAMQWSVAPWCPTTPSPSGTWSSYRCRGTTASATAPRPRSSSAGSSRTWRPGTSGPSSGFPHVPAETAWLIRPPGLVPYAAANELMHDLAARRLRDEIPDTLILLEHPPVYTAGRRSSPDHVVWPEDAMRAAGAEFHRVDRGGSV